MIRIAISSTCYHSISPSGLDANRSFYGTVHRSHSATDSEDNADNDDDDGDDADGSCRSFFSVLPQLQVQQPHHVRLLPLHSES